MTDSNIMAELAEAAAKNQGGAKAIKGIKGLKVKDIQPPEIEIILHEPANIEMPVGNQITIAGKSFIGGTMEITVKSKMTTVSCMEYDDNKELRLKAKSCTVELISCKTNLPSSMLPKIVNKFLNSTLTKVLPGMMCPAADKVLLHIEEKMKKAFEECPIGERGTMQYTMDGLPEVYDGSLNMKFKPVVRDRDGNEIPNVCEAPGSEGSSARPDGITQVIIPTGILNTVLELFKKDMDCDATSDSISDLTVGKMKEMIPGLPDMDPSKKVKLEIRSVETPKVRIEDGKSVMTVHSTIDVKTDPDNEPVCTIDMEHKWDAGYEQLNDTMKVFLLPETGRTTAISVTSPSVGDINEDQLKEYMQNAIVSNCVPGMNDALEKNQMKMPNLMGADYNHPAFKMVEGVVIIEVDHSNVEDDSMVHLEKFKNMSV
ncbi:BPI fold-containing family B member 6-like [Podarcis raffonei]|uniref:BPI fold-containing family B member 6-like n=1 Tax=Podarcis raffonei TaxID=65483 RepID=UPI0023291A6E|nr:BPI fold-containing family B member 6-like [Podarcis raffonei]